MTAIDMDTLTEKLWASQVPQHDHGGLIRWIQSGILPGSFLTAVLANDLRDACRRADEQNRHALYWIVFFLTNYAPMDCWGSEAKVEAWGQRHRKERQAADAVGQREENPI